MNYQRVITSNVSETTFISTLQRIDSTVQRNDLIAKRPYSALAPARKSHRIGLLFTRKNCDLLAISVTEQSCAAPISKVEGHISDSCSYYTDQLFAWA